MAAGYHEIIQPEKATPFPSFLERRERGTRTRRKLAAEAFGTFALVFAGTGAIVIDAVSGGAITHVGVAITFGLIVLEMVYAIGDVSCAARRFEGRMVVPYIVAQGIGAVLASISMKLMFPTSGLLAGVAIGAMIGLEAMFAGPISGASMNPARSLAPALLSLRLEHLWLYPAAPILGAVASVAVCRCVQSPGCCGGVVEGPCP